MNAVDYAGRVVSASTPLWMLVRMDAESSVPEVSS